MLQLHTNWQNLVVQLIVIDNTYVMLQLDQNNVFIDQKAIHVTLLHWIV